MAQIDLATLWDFADPAASEQRFRAAVAQATGDDRLILETQIARTHGLRGDFDAARAILKPLASQMGSAGPTARVRYELELGRSFASATHPAPLSAQAREQGRAAYLSALQQARAAQLDALAIDALHMLAFVDSAPADQLKWTREALAVAETSAQADARRWQAALRNNAGMALHHLGRDEEALLEFQQALDLRKQGSNATATRIAHWMVAWTLRSLQRGDEALAIQLRLEQECDAAGAPDPHVFDELALLYRARGDTGKADFYAQRRRALDPPAASPG